MVQIACPCPPLADGEPRHESDEVELRERLGFVEASAVRNGVVLYRGSAGEDFDEAMILAVLTEGYVLYGIESWTLEDDDGPVPVTRPNIRALILENWPIATAVADAADLLYTKAVMLPLLGRASTSSRPSPTEASTSPSPSSPTEPLKPSSPSSTSTTRTAGTGTTTSRPGGDSRSSPSSATAA